MDTYIPPSVLPRSFSFFLVLIRNTDLGDYIYIHTLRTHIGNRTWKPRALLDVQFLHTFPAFCLLFCVSIGFAFDRVEPFVLTLSVRPWEQNRLPFTQESSHMHTRMYTTWCIHGSDADLSPFRGITYISEIRFAFMEFVAVTLAPNRRRCRFIKISMSWQTPSNPTVYSYCKQ